jgi:prepilin-type N-terminal cleavage/methylation domain-containing protein
MALNNDRGFTLLEVMVALTIAVILLGGVMGAISSSLQYSHRVKEKGLVQPLLEAVAQELLVDPEKIHEGQMSVRAFQDAPPVIITAIKAVGTEKFGQAEPVGELYRVMLSCRGQHLELSLLVPKSALE